MVATSNALAGPLTKAVLLAAILCATACDVAPPAPTDGPINLTGTWRGNIAVDSVSATMTWTLTQAATSVNGPVLIGLPTGTVLLNGLLTGTLTGTTLAYTVSVPPGGVLSQPGCSGQIAGVAMVANGMTMNGTYKLAASTCPTGLTSGSFTLTKQ